MRESFLHFVWQFQKFDAIDIKTSEDQSIQIFSVGQLNTHAGPDFLNAKIQIDDITWYGHVEIHINSSDWDRHAHQNDEAYDNVILHIVWNHDKQVARYSGSELQVLELKDKIEPKLLNRCNELLKNPNHIPCHGLIQDVKKLDIISMTEKVAVERIESKSELILERLEANKGSWEETTYQLLARNFGFKRNDEPFEKLSRALPLKILMKHATNMNHLEALLFGMAGFLPDQSKDPQTQKQINDFKFFAKKYGTSDRALLKVEWKFLRMRPGNFPTVRLSQFASFLHHNRKFFDAFINFTDPKELIDMVSVSPSEYWIEHYDFGKKASRKNKGMGQSSIELIMVNTVAPLLAAYARFSQNSRHMEKAIELLQSLKPESNHIISEWGELDINCANAFDSQGLIQLRNEYCLKKRCLSCKIGVNLINR